MSYDESQKEALTRSFWRASVLQRQRSNTAQFREAIQNWFMEPQNSYTAEEIKSLYNLDTASQELQNQILHDFIVLINQAKGVSTVSVEFDDAEEVKATESKASLRPIDRHARPGEVSTGLSYSGVQSPLLVELGELREIVDFILRKSPQDEGTMLHAQVQNIRAQIGNAEMGSEEEVNLKELRASVIQLLPHDQSVNDWLDELDDRNHDRVRLPANRGTDGFMKYRSHEHAAEAAIQMCANWDPSDPNVRKRGHHRSILDRISHLIEAEKHLEWLESNSRQRSKRELLADYESSFAELLRQQPKEVLKKMREEIGVVWTAVKDPTFSQMNDTDQAQALQHVEQLVAEMRETFEQYEDAERIRVQMRELYSHAVQLDTGDRFTSSKVGRLATMMKSSESTNSLQALESYLASMQSTFTKIQHQNPTTMEDNMSQSQIDSIEKKLAALRKNGVNDVQYDLMKKIEAHLSEYKSGAVTDEEELDLLGKINEKFDLIDQNHSKKANLVAIGLMTMAVVTVIVAIIVGFQFMKATEEGTTTAEATEVVETAPEEHEEAETDADTTPPAPPALQEQESIVVDAVVIGESYINDNDPMLIPTVELMGSPIDLLTTPSAGMQSPITFEDDWYIERGMKPPSECGGNLLSTAEERQCSWMNTDLNIEYLEGNTPTCSMELRFSRAEKSDLLVTIANCTSTEEGMHCPEGKTCLAMKNQGMPTAFPVACVARAVDARLTEWATHEDFGPNGMLCPTVIVSEIEKPS